MQDEGQVSQPRTPYPLRLDAELRKKAEEEAARLDRSLHWVLIDKLRAAFGMKEAA